MANLTLRSSKGSALTHAELDGNFEYFTGSIDAINDATASFLTSADTASFITSADTGSFLTGADTGSFVTTSQTSSLNISDTLYTVNAALSASITSSATTSVCIYGVNVFEYVTPTNYATKLPQPTTGKSVRIINRGNTLLKVFPSNVGGNINNYPVDTPAVIPPDGNLYEFICVKNPLPGAWTFSAPATGQYDSGDIEISVTSISNAGDNPKITAIDSNAKCLIESFFNGSVSIDGKNKPTKLGLDYNPNIVNPYYDALFFRPATPWKGVSKIKIYTNLIPTYNNDGDEVAYGDIYLMGSGYYTSYRTDTGSITGIGNNSGNDLFRFRLNNKISGTPTPGSTVYTAANIGDPGTLWGEKIANTDIYSDVSIGDDVEGPFIGNKSISITPYSGSNESLQGKDIEEYYSSYISFQMDLLPYVDYGTIPDFKFRFIIEYYQ